MTITLSHQQTFVLAKMIAEDIHTLVITRNLRLVGDFPGSAKFDRDQLAEIRASIHSITDPWERRSFIGDIKFLLKGIRKEKGTHIRGRDFVAQVNSYRRAAQSPARYSAPGHLVD